MAVWESSDDTLAEAIQRTAGRICVVAFLALILVGPPVVGGLIARAATSDRLPLTDVQLIERNLPTQPVPAKAPATPAAAKPVGIKPVSDRVN